MGWMAALAIHTTAFAAEPMSTVATSTPIAGTLIDAKFFKGKCPVFGFAVGAFV